MRGTVKIGERDVDMLANAASPFIYKKIFHKDFLMTVGTNYVDADGKQKTDVDTNAITEMAFVMHMQTVKTFKEILDTVTVEDFVAWISEFEPLDFAMAMAEIMGLYYQQQKTTVSPKKKAAQTERPYTTALFVLRALEAGIPISDLDFFDMGDIYDILAEHANDRETYARTATQEDMDKF